jgi:hypothetical protein
MPAAKMRQIVPREYGGKWVVWTADHTRIAAVADSPEEAWSAAERVGVRDPILLWVPAADERFVGGGM